MKIRLLVLLLAAAPLCPALTVKRLPDGVLLDFGTYREKVAVYADDIIRVTASPEADAAVRPSLDALPASRPQPSWEWQEGPAGGVLRTGRIEVRVDARDGRLSFLDASGVPILAEKPGVEKLTPAVVQGETTFHVRAAWEPHADEAFFGLGQNQFGLVDLKGHDL
ncbi:MAG TPA: DUF4968 domain-containing protein, partial [Opitutaceae bacterium]|nr:DUF4968 domain-containing protein [Opitutaceae bacterium]